MAEGEKSAFEVILDEWDARDARDALPAAPRNPKGFQRPAQARPATSDEAVQEGANNLLKARLSPLGVPFKLPKGDIIMAHVKSPHVYVFYVFGDASGVIRCDTDGNFPSDELIGQLRLVML
jgi:hypothetical protein